MENEQSPTIEIDDKLRDAFVESLTQKSNPLEVPVISKEFVAEPFFKAPEEPKTEVAGEDAQKLDAVGKPVITEVKDPVVEAKKEPETSIVNIEAQSTPNKDEITEAELIAILKQSIPDFNASTLEDFKAILDENKKYKDSASQLSTLSQEDRARIEIGKEHGDFGLFDRIISINVDQLTDKEAIKQKFFLEHIGKNPQLLEKQFEKTYAKTYEEEPDEEFTKLLLEDNAKEAKEDIKKLQADFKSRGKIDGQVDPAIAKQKQAESDRLWQEDVDKVLNAHDRVIYELENSKLNIVMDVADKIAIQKAMDNPIEYVKNRITNKEGKFDHKALYELIMWDTYKEKALKEAHKLGAAHAEETLLKQNKGKAEVPIVPTGNSDAKINVGELIADGLKAFR